jgi:UDP-3-O-[3-hydroxymyristoyl] glucosamine N-acyltransferase
MNAEPDRHRLSALAERFALELRADRDPEIGGVGTLTGAAPDQLAFLANRGYRKFLAGTRAGAVVLSPDDAAHCPAPCLVSDNPYLAYARIAALFDTRPVAEPGVHASAQVDPGARLGEGVHVGAGAVIAAGSVVGDGCEVGPGCVLQQGCEVGAGSRLVANVTLCHGVRLGRRVIVHPGAVIGADGFGIAPGPEGWTKVPQLGAVVIGDDCEIGANTCIDRGAIEDTVLEEDVRVDNLCQIGHNCHIGAHTALAAYTGLSGSTKIGRHCLFGGRTGTSGHLEVADRVTVTGMTMVTKSIGEVGMVVSAGIPAQPAREWQRTVARLRRLDALGERLTRLERALAEKNHKETDPDD